MPMVLDARGEGADVTKVDRIRAALKQALEVRKGEVLTPEVIENRSRNGAIYIMELLENDCRNSGRETDAQDHEG